MLVYGIKHGPAYMETRRNMNSNYPVKHTTGIFPSRSSIGSGRIPLFHSSTPPGCPNLTGPEFFERAFQKDPVCLELFTHWAQRTGRVFANMALLLDMQGIVVGGGISAQGDALTLPLQRAMDSCLPVSFRDSCRVVPAQLGNHAALLGAASLLADREN